MKAHIGLRLVRVALFSVLICGCHRAVALSLDDYNALYQKAESAFDAVDPAAPNADKLDVYMNVLNQLGRLEGDAQVQPALARLHPDWITRTNDLQTRVQDAIVAVAMTGAACAADVKKAAEERDALHKQNLDLQTTLDTVQARLVALEAEKRAIEAALVREAKRAQEVRKSVERQVAQVRETLKNVKK